MPVSTMHTILRYVLLSAENYPCSGVSFCWSARKTDLKSRIFDCWEVNNKWFLSIHKLTGQRQRKIHSHVHQNLFILKRFGLMASLIIGLLLFEEMGPTGFFTCTVNVKLNESFFAHPDHSKTSTACIFG